MPLIVWLISSTGLALPYSYLIIIFISIPVTALGIYFLCRSFGLEKKFASTASFLYVVLPAIYLVMPYQNGLKYPAVSLVPFLLISYKDLLKKPGYYKWLINVLIITIILLINSAALLMLLLSLLALIFSLSTQDKGMRVFEMLLALISGIIVSSFWYTPEYWLTLMINPSTGGMPFYHLIIWSVRNLIQIMPVIAVLYLLRINHKKYKQIQIFAQLILIAFIILTLIRLLMDPDFIMDWSGFAPEIQIGTALFISSYRHRLSQFKKYIYIVFIICFIFSVYYVSNLISSGIKINSINNNYKNTLRKTLLNYVANNERIFVSGDPVFWLNDKTGILQVRGGNDNVSMHSMWAHGAYQIREGLDTKLAADWLRALGASYVLVHTEKSAEYFKDFKNTLKYKDIKQFRELSSKNGNILYKVTDSAVARIADRKLLKAQFLRSGADKHRLSEYVSYFKRKIFFKYNNVNEITVSGNILPHEVISLAVTYDRRWVLKNGEGKIIQDTINNIVIIPNKTGRQSLILQYQKTKFDWLFPVTCLLMINIVYKFRNKIYLVLNGVLQRFSFGLNETDEDY